VHRQKVRDKRFSIIKKVDEKLTAARLALCSDQPKDLANALRGIERLAKKILEMSA
jgi:hypothetical protein